MTKSIKIRHSAEARSKAILLMHEGKSVKDISQTLSIPIPTLKNWKKSEGKCSDIITITPEQKDEVASLLKSGVSKADISRALGLTRSQVIHASKSVDHARRARHDEDKKDKIRHLVLGGASYKSLHAKFGIPINTMKFWMKGKRSKKLPAEKVSEIRRRVLAGDSKAKVARDLGVGENSVRAVTVDINRAHPQIPQSKRDEFIRRVRSGESPIIVGEQLQIAATTHAAWAREAQLTLSDAEKDKVLSFLSEKRSTRFIAEELGVPRLAVNKLRAEFEGNPIQKRSYSAEQKLAAIKACEEGKTIKEVAKLVGAREAAVSNWFIKAIESGNAVRPPKKPLASRDETFTWIAEDYPEFEDWRESASDWVKTSGHPPGPAIKAISGFIKDYLHKLNLPTRRLEILRKDTTLPSFYEHACTDTLQGVRKNNLVHEFLDWILANPEFSDIDDDGAAHVLPGFRNPVKRISAKGAPQPDVSVRSVLPYLHVEALRHLIAEGKNFSDWKTAMSLAGIPTERGGIKSASDWFKVHESAIDRSDSDCVWRIRRPVREAPYFEMWSPVRWVLLLIKLLIPARTGQIRMSDSGESDTYRFENGAFHVNAGPLADGTSKRPWQQGIIRRVANLTGGESKVLFLNNNKTADTYRRGTDIGQECPWPSFDDFRSDPYFWLEKLRNWQEKYNPIKTRTHWNKVPPARELSPLSDEAKSKYPLTCFLFRTPESKGEEHLPISPGTVNKAWHYLLRRYQETLDSSSSKNPDGSSQRIYDLKSRSTDFDLHGLRVSLITHLVVDGGISPEIMQRIVGHARMLMTLYYTKPSLEHMNSVVADAVERINALKDERATKALSNSSEEELERRLVFNSDSWRGFLAIDPTDRNPIGWLAMHDGICLAGGNTDAIEGNSRIPGCHNGGPQSRHNDKDFEPVSGGVRNCCRCRWKVYEKSHGPAMVASLNNKLYHLHCRQEAAIKASRDLVNLKKERSDAESAGVPFLRGQALMTAQRLYEGAMAHLDQLASDVSALCRSIERVKALPDTGEEGVKLIAKGGTLAMHTIFEDAPSELLQLSVLCSDIEIYPDLDPGTAVYRRAQLLDGALEREGLPPVFMLLSQEEMLSYGNAYMRKLSLLADPENPAIGLRRVVQSIDSGSLLSAALGISIGDALPITESDTTHTPYRRELASKEGNDDET